MLPRSILLTEVSRVLLLSRAVAFRSRDELEPVQLPVVDFWLLPAFSNAQILCMRHSIRDFHFPVV